MKKAIYLFLLVWNVWGGSSICPAQQNEVSTGDGVTKAAKHFVDLLAKDEFPAGVNYFDDTMKRALPAAKLEQEWNSLKARYGSFQGQAGVRRGKFQQYDVAFVACEFDKTDLDVKLMFNRRGQIAGLIFVPTQARSSKPGTPGSTAKDSVRQKEVLVGQGKWAVHGTLSLPGGSGPFPAVVLVQGSGPHDRDETIGPNKPFRDLAEGLVSGGIAVLRYEKRTREHAAQLARVRESITVKEETTDDAIAAVSLLRKQKQIDPKKVFVLGHSLGGMMIPRIGARVPGIAGLIILAGSSRPLEDVIVEQMSYIFSLDNTISGSEQSQLDSIKVRVARVKDPNLSARTPSTSLPLGVPAAYWLNLRGYNPADAAGRLKQPVLILQGGRDYQVTMDDFEGWKRALSTRSNVEFKVYPNLNHLFFGGTGKSTPEEYRIAGHVSQLVVTDIAHWIKTH